MSEYVGGERAVHGAPAVALVAQLVLLGALAATVGLGAPGWVVGGACALLLDAALARELVRDGSRGVGPAGCVTLARATLGVGVAGLAADSFAGSISVATLVALAAVALVLDFVDGHVARRTETASQLGARLDGEVDAFLILVLSVYVARLAGGWVLAIGAARYVFYAAGWLLPWMRAPLPRRDWRKTVTAAQGVALAVAAADVLPAGFERVLLAGALALLGESFGRDVLWLWRHRHDPRAAAAERHTAAPAGARAAVATALSALALVLVWAALVAPDEPGTIKPEAFLRVPLEGLVVVLLALALPRTARRVLACLVGPVLGALVIVKILDFGFFTAFDRPFDPFNDWSYTSIGIETLRASVGRTEAKLVIAGVVLLAVAALVVPTLALLRLMRLAASNGRRSLQVVAGLGAVWLLCWAFGVELVSGAPVASTSAAGLAVDEVQAVQAGFHDRTLFAAEIRHDRYRATPGNRLLTGLRGKDVLLVFVESYGKVAVQGSSFSPGVDAVLARGDRQLHSAGFSAQSGWLTSSTFGGISWLAHSTLESGTWVDSKGRYDQLIGSDRFTLNQAFRRAGWRVVDDTPSNDRGWTPGRTFYHYEKVYDRRNVGYRGPTYAYASMPDQYVYLALQRHELGRPDRPPLFAEIDLVSSHEPWTQVPPLIPWNEVGDGSIFYKLPVDMAGAKDAKQGYGHSIEYTLRTLFSFVQHYGRKNLVMVVLGDHQPAKTVSGENPDHDVPISVIAHDPKVFDRIGSWGWVDGMRPTSQAPVWRMSAFRDRFLAAFGPQR